MFKPLLGILGARRAPAAAGDPHAATRDDVVACFRLLLGREPNPEEMAGHLAQVGRPLNHVVAGYLNSLEFARRGLLDAQDEAPTLAQLDGFRLYAHETDLAVGRHVLHGAYEPEVERVFRRVLLPGMGVIDVGANIGYLSMLSAVLVGPEGYVLAVEPNPANARLIEASRRLNGFEHLVVAQLAAGRRTGLLTLNATHSNGTTSDPSAELGALLKAQTVACVKLDTLAPMDRRIALLKLDVEGAEYNALLGAQALLERDRPLIVSEFSPALMPGISGIDGPGYLRWLHAKGYMVSIIELEGGVRPAGQDVLAVMQAYEQRGADHIDLLAEPG